MQPNFYTTLVLCLLAEFCHAGKFLFYFPFVAPSAIITLTPLVHELAARGHSLTLLVPFPVGETFSKRVRVIVIDARIAEMWTKYSTEILEVTHICTNLLTKSYSVSAAIRIKNKAPEMSSRNS